MKEKTKAFYKAVFKYWVKEKLIPFVIAVVLMIIIGFVHYFLNANIGYTALFILTWQEVKRIWSDRKNE